MEIVNDKEKYELEILKLKKENFEIKNKNLKNSKSKKITNYLSTTNNNTINNINYICNFVAREPLDSPNHIKNLLTRKEQIEFAKETHPSNFITRAIQKTYCEQFKNVLLTNLNAKHLYIFKDGRFVVARGNETLENMVKGKYWEVSEMIEGLLDEKKNKQPRINNGIMEKLYIKKNDFIEEIKNDNFTKKNKDRTIIMLYNNQDNIKKTYTIITDEELNEEQLEQIYNGNIEIDEIVNM